MDAHQRNQVEDYSDGRLSSDNSGESRQQLHRESSQSFDNLQQKHGPKQSYQSSNPQESYMSSDLLQQQHQPRKNSQSSDHLKQKNQPQESYQNSDNLKQQYRPRETYQSSDHLQQRQESYPSSDNLQQQHRPPKGYQSFNHLQQQQQTIVTVTPTEAYAVNSGSSLINKVTSDQLPSVTDHSRDAYPSGHQSSHSQTPRVEAPSTHGPNPNNYNHQSLPLYHEEHDDSAEALDKNVRVRRPQNKPKSSCCQ